MSNEAKKEVWFYKGVCRCKGNKRGNEWLDANGKELVYPYKKSTGSGSIIGHAYEVEVTCTDAGSITMHGRPKWLDTSEHPPHEDKFEWEAQSRAEQGAWEDTNTEKRLSKTENSFDAKLDDLNAVYRKCSAAQRRALLSYMISKITKV